MKSMKRKHIDEGSPTSLKRRKISQETTSEKVQEPYPEGFLTLMASEFHVNEESWNPKEYFQGCDCWVYKKDDEIVGAAVTENTKGKPDTNYATLVHSFVIDKNHRKQGHGTKFWRSLEHHIVPPVGLYISVTTEELLEIIQPIHKYTKFPLDQLKRLLVEEKPFLDSSLNIQENLEIKDQRENFDNPANQKEKKEEEEDEGEEEHEDKGDEEEEDDYDFDDDWLVNDDEEEELQPLVKENEKEINEKHLKSDNIGAIKIRDILGSKILELQAADFENVLSKISDKFFNEAISHPNGAPKNLKYGFWSKQGFEADPRTFGLIENDMVCMLQFGMFV